jgi:hypothetical protein
MTGLRRRAALVLFLTWTLAEASCIRESGAAEMEGKGGANQRASSAKAGGDASSIANVVVQGVGKVTRASPPRGGAPVIVLEERHNSRIGQIQHAMVLIRLRERYGLKTAVLEGYLKGEPEITTDWFTKSVRPGTPEARANVAVRALMRGDISAVEFTKLVYPDLAVHTAEERENYFVEPPSSLPMGNYLQQIAGVDRQWALEKAKPYQSAEGFQKLSGDQKAKSAREIMEYAEKIHVSIAPGDAQAMLKYITFFERRMASNSTIADSVSDVLRHDPRSAVAANIGADHSAGLAKLLDQANRSYAIISPLYVPSDKDKGDLSDEAYDRKNKRLPVFSTGAAQLFYDAGSRKKKPQPVVNQDWFQAQAEWEGLVASAAQVLRTAPPPPGGPPPGGPPRQPPRSSEGPPPPPDDKKPPFGLSEKDFDGKRVQLLVGATEYVKRKDGRPVGLLIPVLFKDTGRKIWTGVRLQTEGTAATRAQARSTQATAPQGGVSAVEQILASALTEVEREDRPPDRLENQTGEIQIGLDVSALVGTDPSEVRKLLLERN